MATFPGKYVQLLAGVAMLATGLSFGVPNAAEAGGKRTVLELFTSQGCSSCPPADLLMQKYAADKDVLALSFAVDYWDYLGWKDTLASRDNTKRQYAYAARRGDRSVYTPQIVINGREHAVGSDRRAVDRSIKRQEKAHGGAMAVDVDLSVSKDLIKIKLGGAQNAIKDQTAKIWLVLYNEKETVKIGRGENRGETITYTNVVRDMIPLGSWKGHEATLDIARKSIKSSYKKYDHCVVIVQREDHGRPGEIIGASDTERMKGS